MYAGGFAALLPGPRGPEQQLRHRMRFQPLFKQLGRGFAFIAVGIEEGTEDARIKLNSLYPTFTTASE